jgi:hypothetical protein
MINTNGVQQQERILIDDDESMKKVDEQQEQQHTYLNVDEPSLSSHESSPVNTPRRRTKEELRTDVEREIETSEQKYVEGLIHLEHCYISPLKLIISSKPKGMITMKEFHNLFQSIFVIKNVNERLLESLTAVSSGHPKVGEETIGKIFLRLGPMLKSYTDYVNNYDDMVKSIKEFKKAKPTFDSFMTAIENKAVKDGKVGFFSYMISPVQRIPRYTLLLRELLKYTDESHADYENVVKALELTQSVSSHVNERLREVENGRKLVWLHHNISNLESHIENFFQTARRILNDGSVFIVHRTGRSEMLRVRHLYLMNDMVLFVKKNKYKAHALLNSVPEIWVHADPEVKTDFIIATNQFVYTLRVLDQENRTAWINKLNDAIANVKRERKEELPKAIIHKRTEKSGKKKELPLAIAQADNDKVVPFVKGDYLIVHYDYQDGSSLVSLARDNTNGCRVRNIFFRDMTNDERLACEFVSESEKQRIREPKSDGDTSSPQRNSQSDMRTPRSRRPTIPTEYITALHHSINKQLGIDTTDFDPIQQARRAGLLMQIKMPHLLKYRGSADDIISMTTDDSTTTFDDTTELDDESTQSDIETPRQTTPRDSGSQTTPRKLINKPPPPPPPMNKFRSFSAKYDNERKVPAIPTTELKAEVETKTTSSTSDNRPPITKPRSMTTPIRQANQPCPQTLSQELRSLNFKIDPNLDEIIQQKSKERSFTASQVNNNPIASQLRKVDASDRQQQPQQQDQQSKAPWLRELETKGSNILKKMDTSNTSQS